MKIRITKEFHFEMSHCLNNYDGLCANIHGHSYKLFVCLCGEPSEDKSSSSYGMVMDFSKLKKIVQKEVLDLFDHALIIENNSPFIKQVQSLNTKKEIVNFQPTCENLVLFIKDKIYPLLPSGVELYSVTLFETASSQAMWCKNDNV
ncbi:MAG: 6-pyruvoyl trahydropterin synthase family protein [Bacteroidales bacterium]